MASPALQKLLRNRSESASKLFTLLRQRPLPQNPQFVLTHFPHLAKSHDALPFQIRPEWGFLQSGYPFSECFYPAFSFGLFLNPTSPASIMRSKPDAETIEDDSHVIRADSVKKKRKKKMNKHKLNKLRKRLRKRT